MFKKIFYSFTILAMLFGMFGVMGRGGVTPAFAASGVNESALTITVAADLTPLPFSATGAFAGVTEAGSPVLAGELLNAWIYVGAVIEASTVVVTWDPANVLSVPVIAAYVPNLAAQPVALLFAGSFLAGVAGGVVTYNIPVPAATALYVMIGTTNAAIPGAGSTVNVVRAPAFPTPIDNTFGSTLNSALPFHGRLTDFTTLTWQLADPVTSCISDFNWFTGWEQVTTGPTANFLHVHSTTEFSATIAVFNDSSGGLGTEVGCRNSGAGYAFNGGVPGTWLHDADLIVPVTPNTVYHVYIAPTAFGPDLVVAGDDADLWIAEFEYGGGIIVNLCETLGAADAFRCDLAAEPLTGATVQAQLSTGGTIYTDIFDGVLTGNAGLGVWTSTIYGDLFVDVPDPAAGTSYTLGISSLVDAQTPDTIWFVPAVGSFLALDPDDSTSFKDSLTANHVFLNRTGAPLNAIVSVAAAGGVLPNFELPLGTAALGTLPDFRIIPGGFYDFEAILPIAAGGTDFYLVSRGPAPVLPGVDCLNVLATCRLAFDTRDVLPGAFAHPHASIDRNRNVASWDYVDFAVGATGTNFAHSRIFDWADNDDIVVSAGVPLYMDAEVDDSDVPSEQWIMQATTPGPIPSTMAPNTALTPFRWELLWDVDWADPTDASFGLSDLFTTLTAPGLLAAPVGNEVPWTSAAGNSVTASYTEYVDDFGNILIAVSPIDYLRHDYFPIWPYDPALHHATGEISFNRVTTNDPWVYAWQILGDDLGAVDPAYVAGSLPLTGLQIARNVIERCVDTSTGSEIDPRCPYLLYAISPTDTRMSGHWSWSWVEGMYEMGLTTGTAPGVYSPDMTISRAEMAVFLSRLLSDYSAVLPPPAATGLAFTDVAVGQWAAKYIEQLKAYNISGDCNPLLAGDQYCPDGMVTRAEMAKFIQQTFRVLVANAGVAAFDTDFNVITPGTIFVDVPAGNWAAFWTDEMAWDQLTEGCRTEMSGFAFIHYYCPNEPVTRGQMAKFIVRGKYISDTIQDGWPILAPER